MLVSFFCTVPATTEIYTLSLHDALPICSFSLLFSSRPRRNSTLTALPMSCNAVNVERSEEHTSELQSRGQLVCRLLLEKRKSTGACTRAGAAADGWRSAPRSVRNLSAPC